jgi:hypothetical protein
MTVLTTTTHERADMPRNFLTAASSAGTAALLLLAVSACGGGSNATGTTPATDTQQNQSAQPGAGSGQGFPGASGKVAAISGKTLQVQSQQTGQVAVTYTAKTKFTESVKTTAATVRVGSCVSVRSSAVAGTTPKASDPVTAASVMLSQPVNGACELRGGGFGGGGFNRTGNGGTRPSGAPSGAPGAGGGQGAAGRGFGGALPVSGKVTAVDGSTITVAAVSFRGGRAAGTGGTASPNPTPSPTSVEVTTTAATTYTKTVSATAKALAVGQCVTAIGSANDTGAITATTIASQPPVNGECGGGFGARRTGTGSGGTTTGGTS